MTRCARCKWKYPDELVSTFRSSAGNSELCGICALQASNELHGMNRKKFGGPMAEDFRLDAIEWRRKHTELKPKL